MEKLDWDRKLNPVAHTEAVALYSNLSNEEMMVARKEISAKLKSFDIRVKEELRMWNHYAVHWRYLTRSIDWGYRVHDMVLRSTHLGYVADKIIAIDDTQYYFRTVGLDVDLLRPINDETVKRYSGPAKV